MSFFSRQMIAARDVVRGHSRRPHQPALGGWDRHAEHGRKEVCLAQTIVVPTAATEVTSR